MTFRELGNSVVQIINEILYQIYKTLVNLKEKHPLDLEIIDVVILFVLFIGISGLISYLINEIFGSFISKICNKFGYDYNEYDDKYVTFIILSLTLLILVYLINFLIPSYQ